MFAVRYHVGNKKYEKVGFPTHEAAGRFIMKNTAAFMWQIFRIHKGKWFEVK